MSTQLDISGGAGGFQAAYEDQLTSAKILRDSGDELGQISGRVGGMAVDGDLLASGVICPDKTPGVVAGVGASALSLKVRSEAIWAAADIIILCVETYQLVDAAQEAFIDALWLVGGYAAGLALPGIIVVGGIGTLAYLSTNPALAVQAYVYVTSGQLVRDLERTAYEHPWMMDILSKSAPGLIPGLAHSLSGPLFPLVSAASGGKWPPTSYEESVAGLLNLLQLGGMMKDEGDFYLSPSRRPDITGLHLGTGNAVERVFNLHDIMDEDVRLAGEDPKKHAQLQLVTVYDKDGNPDGVIVQIPGTEVWDLSRGTNTADAVTNVNAILRENGVMKQMVEEALARAQAEHPDLPVMLSGHSQGGIVAAALASDQAWVDKYNVTSVMTAGSPIGQMPISDSVSVMALEHEQDPVPMIDGKANPDRPNWITVRHDLPQSLGTAAGASGPDPITAHGTRQYAHTGALIDQSSDPSVVAWREQNSVFLGGAHATASKYDILPGRAPASVGGGGTHQMTR